MQESAVRVGRSVRESRAEYGSDLVVETLRDLRIPYIALNPGSSYRGIHDSLVNFQSENVPEMIMCLHEEIAIALAHGYALASGQPLVAAVHNVVGLQHASMAIYNAWCDRVPLIVIGGTGPMIAANRRNHIEWVHTALVQGNLVRDFVKWDDQPSSIEDFQHSLLRAYRTSMTQPHGPVYVCFDADLQEQAIPTPMSLDDPGRYAPPSAVGADPEAIARAADLLAAAEWPVILADGVGRQPEALPFLTTLAELLAAPVVSVGSRFNFATNHPLNLSLARRETLGEADLVLGLDVFDLASGLGPGSGEKERSGESYIRSDARIIHIGLWDLLQHSLISDYERLMPVDVAITADTRLALASLVEACREALARDSGAARRIEQRAERVRQLHAEAKVRAEAGSVRAWNERPISDSRLNGEIWNSIKDYPWTLVHGGARAASWNVTEPEQLIGGGRGAGLGQAGGASVGAALAYRPAERLCVSVIGDGDLLYTPSALWTAAHHSIPLLMIVNNNRSYGNDEGHQEYVARVRGRPVENKGVGIYIEEPNPDFPRLAASFGVEGFGPIDDPAQLQPVLKRAAQIVMNERRPVLVDVVTQRR